MKNANSKGNKNSNANPVREGKPNSIADGKMRKDKRQYPYPGEKDIQYKDQPEFIDPGSNSSKKDH